MYFTQKDKTIKTNVKPVVVDFDFKMLKKNSYELALKQISSKTLNQFHLDDYTVDVFFFPIKREFTNSYFLA